MNCRTQCNSVILEIEATIDMISYIGKGRTLAIAAAMLAIAPTARAQAYIGVVVGQMAAQEHAAALEAACKAGAPASERAVTVLTARMDRAMAAYFALTPKSVEHAIMRIFSVKAPGVHWMNAAELTPVAQLGEHLNPPPATPVRLSAVVGGDARSGRGLWSVVPAAGAPLVYAVDFVSEPHGWTDPTDGLRIVHMSVSPASAAPAQPGAFCHLDAVHGF